MARKKKENVMSEETTPARKTRTRIVKPLYIIYTVEDGVAVEKLTTRDVSKAIEMFQSDVSVNKMLTVQD